jgi:hypothetical protein
MHYTTDHLISEARYKIFNFFVNLWDSGTSYMRIARSCVMRDTPFHLHSLTHGRSASRRFIESFSFSLIIGGV